MIEIETPFGDARLRLTVSTVDELRAAYAALGGNADALVAQIGGKLRELETGRAVAAVERAGLAQGAPAAQGDPWGAPGVQPVSAPPTAPLSGTVTVETPRGPQTWQLNPPGGPSCMCGNPAARVTAAKSNGKGTYTAYRCAKGSGQDWRAKCDFNQWA